MSKFSKRDVHDSFNGYAYTMSPLIQRYYHAWIMGPTLLEHPLDQERFYKFVKACVRYSRKRIHGTWLRSFLEHDIRERYNAEASQKVVHKIILLFDSLVEFYRTPFPDVLVEGRNPWLVKGELERFIKGEEGTENRLFPPDEVERILAERFGTNWRELWPTANQLN